MKHLVMFLLLLMLVMILGCQGSSLNNPPDSLPQEQTQEDPDRTEEPDENEPVRELSTESLGGIRLGMSGEEVESLLGKDYEDEIYDEGGYFGESLIIRKYSDGCDLVIGKDSNMVFQVDVYSENYPTSLGFKVGDPSIQVIDKYRSQYEEFVGRHSSEKLLGWFIIDDEDELLIFSSMENRERYNGNITADSEITGITLGRARYFD